jgi:hypothetical protein
VSLQVAPTCGEATAEGQMALAAAETSGRTGTHRRRTNLPQAMRREATARAGTPSRRHDDAVVVWVCLRQFGRRDLGPGWAGRAGVSRAREFPDESAWQADVGDRGGVGDELCRGALHGRFGGPDAWLQALPDYQLGLR